MMKRIIKNPLLTFVLGAILFGSIGVVSAYTILANDIGYTPQDSTWKKANGEDITTVKDAIDELYTKSNAELIDRIDFSTLKTSYMGNRKSGNRLLINLTQGDYIVSLVNAHAWANSSVFNQKGNIGAGASSFITATNGICEFLDGYYVEPTATAKIDNNRNVSQYTYSILYKCSFTEDGSVSMTTADGNYSDCSQGVIMQALKLD